MIFSKVAAKAWSLHDAAATPWQETLPAAAEQGASLWLCEEHP